ncbi:hypothetical protein ACT453_62395, partial [Bacillus sp. D-CC]
MREENEKVDAVYVENGMIVDVGSKEELESRYAAVTLHNLEGKTIIFRFVLIPIFSLEFSYLFVNFNI